MVAENFISIGFIGCGKMAQALAKGFIAAGNFSFLYNFCTHNLYDIQG